MTFLVNDDSCGVHSRPYHSCVIACVMQVREEHAMGHDSGVHYFSHNYIHAHDCIPLLIYFLGENQEIFQT